MKRTKGRHIKNKQTIKLFLKDLPYKKNLPRSEAIRRQC